MLELNNIGTIFKPSAEKFSGEAEREALFRLIQKEGIFSKDYIEKNPLVDGERSGLLRRIAITKDPDKDQYFLVGEGRWGRTGSIDVSITRPINNGVAFAIMEKARIGAIEGHSQLGEVKHDLVISQLYTEVMSDAEGVLINDLLSGGVEIVDRNKVLGNNEVGIVTSTGISRNEILNKFVEVIELRVEEAGHGERDLSFEDVSLIIDMLSHEENRDEVYAAWGLVDRKDKEYFDGILDGLTKKYAGGRAKNWERMLVMRKDEQRKAVEALLSEVAQECAQAMQLGTIQQAVANRGLPVVVEGLCSRYDNSGIIAIDDVKNITAGWVEEAEKMIENSERKAFMTGFTEFRAEWMKIWARKVIEICETRGNSMSDAVKPVDGENVEEAVDWIFGKDHPDKQYLIHALTHTRMEDAQEYLSTSVEEVTKRNKARDYLRKYVTIIDNKTAARQMGKKLEIWMQRVGGSDVVNDVAIMQSDVEMAKFMADPLAEQPDKEYWKQMADIYYSSAILRWRHSHRAQLDIIVDGQFRKKDGIVHRMKSADAILQDRRRIWYEWQNELRRILLEQALASRADLDRLNMWMKRNNVPSISADNAELMEKLKKDHFRTWKIIMTTRRIAGDTKLKTVANVQDWISTLIDQAMVSDNYHVGHLLTREGAEWREKLERGKKS